MIPRRPAVLAGAAPQREDERIQAALDAANGDLDQAAELLGVSRTTFWRMQKKAALQL